MKAVLLCHNWKTAETLHTQFGEGTEFGFPSENPVRDAYGLWAGIKDDFPESDGWIHTVVGDDEAKTKWGEFQTDRMLGINK